MPLVSLLADIGESYGPYVMGQDDLLLEVISDANVACGFHAGDPMVMDRTVASSLAADVSVGGHPGFPDVLGFGRRAMDLSYDQVRTDVLYQLGALGAFLGAHGLSMAHVNVHGKLDNMAGTDPVYAAAVVDALLAYDPGLVLVAQDGELERRALRAGLSVAYAFMADRGYEDDGQPVDRSRPGALLHDSAQIVDRALQVLETGTVPSVNGVAVPMRCDAVLVHGDTAEAVDNARLLRAGIEAAGVTVAAIPRVVAARVVA